MIMANDRAINFTALTRGLLEDLRREYRERGRRPTRPPEESGIAQIRGAVDRLRSDRDVELEPIGAKYQERAEDATALLSRRQQRVEAYAKRERRAVTADPKKFIVAGRVVDMTTDVGLPNLKVNVIDTRQGDGARLGSTHTDALGYYRLEYTAEDLKKLGAQPRASVQVLGDDGTAIFTSDKTFAQELGQTTFVPARIDSGQVPASRALGTRISESVSNRIDGIKRRIRVSVPKGSLPLRNLAKRPKLGARPERPEGSAQPTRPESPEQPEGPNQPEGLERPLRPVRGGQTDLKDINGVGDRFAARLKKAGITQVSEVAKMQPEKLATILDTSVSRAGSIVAEAHRIANRP